MHEWEAEPATDAGSNVRGSKCERFYTTIIVYTCKDKVYTMGWYWDWP